jgi:hypothetical protein
MPAMTCARCRSPGAEYFSSAGDPLCRTCYFAEQTAAQDGRAADEMRSADAASTLMRAQTVWRGSWLIVGAILLVVAGVQIVGFSHYLLGTLALAAAAGGLGFWRIYRLYR